ncbi:hypothetical protein D3C73_1358040 [compost metagenome]
MAATLAGVKKPATTFRMPVWVSVWLLARTGGSANRAFCSMRSARPLNGVTASRALAGLKSWGLCNTSRTVSGLRSTR